MARKSCQLHLPAASGSTFCRTADPIVAPEASPEIFASVNAAGTHCVFFGIFWLRFCLVATAFCCCLCAFFAFFSLHCNSPKAHAGNVQTPKNRNCTPSLNTTYTRICASDYYLFHCLLACWLLHLTEPKRSEHAGVYVVCRFGRPLT